MKKQIVEQIEKMSGRYSPYNIFSDWVEMMALSIQNTCQQVHDSIWEQREKNYMDICGRYEKKEIMAFGEMTNDNIRTVLKKLAAYEDAEDKLEEMVEKLRNASFERYGNDGMGGEQVVNLDDAIEIVKEGV